MMQVQKMEQFSTELDDKQMLEALTKPSWKIAFEKLQMLNLTNDFHTEWTELERLVLERVRTGRQLSHFLKAYKKTAASPLVLLKQAVLLHLHMQQASPLAVQKVDDFLQLLFTRCDAAIETYGQGETEGWSSKCAVTRSQATTREDEAFLGKEVFLLSKIMRPYLRYLQRLAATFDDYCSLANKQADSVLAWQLVNLLRGITGITGHFVMIGRYFMREYGGGVVLLVGALSKDIALYMDVLRDYVKKQNCVLCCSSAQGLELQEFVSVLSELSTLNEQLMQVFLGKYFYKELRDFQQPQWINPNTSEFDSIFKLAQQQRPKMQEKAKRGHLLSQPSQ